MATEQLDSSIYALGQATHAWLSLHVVLFRIQVKPFQTRANITEALQVMSSMFTRSRSFHKSTRHQS